MKISILLTAALLLAGCGTTQVLATVEAALNGIAALQSALPTAGVSPVLAKEIGDYASAAATGVGQCAALLAAGGETVTLVAKCGQFLSAAVQPVLPPGTPMQVAGLVAAVYAELQVVYAAIEASSGQPSKPVAKTALAAAKPSIFWQPSRHESGRMRALAQRAAKLAKGAR